MRKKIIRIFVFFVLPVFAAGCLKDTTPTLYLYNWTYYTPDSVVEAFEKEYGVRVVYDDYASNEDMFAKLSAGGTGYDLIVPSADFVSILMHEQMLEKIDVKKIPNVKWLNDDVLSRMQYDPDMQYSIPYFMGAAGIAVNTKAVPEFERSWNIFSRTDLKNKMTMMDDMREVMGAALVTLGLDGNSTDRSDIEKAFHLINDRWKPNLVKFDGEGYAKSFAAGDFVVVHGYPEAIYEEIPETMRDDVKFFIPQEKDSPLYIDSWCIPKGAKNIDLAHQFINFVLEPKIYALLLDEFGYPSTIHKTADQYTTTTPHYTKQDIQHCQLKYDLGKNHALYNEYWEKIRFGE